MRSWDQRCPDCDGILFLAGPRGGLAQNILCVNHVCRRKLNVAVWHGRWMVVNDLPIATRDEYMEWWMAGRGFLDTEVSRADMVAWFRRRPKPS